MPTPTLFVGVVSHAGSRFTISQGSSGLAAGLADALPDVEVQVHTADLLEDDSPLVNSASVQATLNAELRLERSWAAFLGRSLGARWWAMHIARWGRRAWLRARPPAPSMIRRLLNIELSHRHLMRAGLASGAPWVLILEDDAFCTDLNDLSAGLGGILNVDPRPAFVNLSESFTPRELGIDHLLAHVVGCTWAGTRRRNVLVAERPVTNTVCAILYSSEFLHSLLEALEGLPIEPIVPIDWRLNEGLMALHDSGTAIGACWMVEPAPIVQMSMKQADARRTG